MKYRNREVVEAEQWFPTPSLSSWCGYYRIQIDETWLHIQPGNYIVTINGRKSIMSKEYFEQRYEPIDACPKGKW